MVSPQVRPGEGHVDTGSLMNLGQLLAQKKQQDRYFGLQTRQYEDPKRQEVLDQLQAALANPDDKVALQSAMAEAKKWGIEVTGLESLVNSEQQQPEQAPATGPAPEEQPKPEAPTGKSNAPAWLDKYMESQGAQTPQGAAVQAQTDAAIAANEDVAPPDVSVPRPGPARATLPGDELVADSLPNPPPVRPRPAGQIGMQGVQRKGREVVISVNGQPYAKFDTDELHGYRAKQSALVAHVFQPLVDNAADDNDKKAAEIAQKQAVEAYNSGMSKQQAIEFGNKAWAQLSGRRFKRDWEKFPPGFKFAAPGGGGGSLGEGTSVKLWDKMNDNERQWVSTAMTEFKVPGAQQAAADAGLIEAATHAETPLAQNQGLMRILKEMSGTAVTNPEAARFYEGIGIMGQAENLWRKIDGGDITESTRNGVREIAQLIRSRAAGQIQAAGDFVYQRIAGDTLFPGSDELRLNRAREVRSLFTGEKTTPMKRNKKGKLEAVNTANDEVDDLTK
jgi:hypothetical protein